MKCVCDVRRGLIAYAMKFSLFTSYFNADIILLRDNTYENTGLLKNKHEYINYTLKQMVTVP